jgi:hypothetical protein
MKITGFVLNKDSKPESFAKVFVSDYKGSITQKKIGAITDGNGKFDLDVTNKDGDYLTATTSNGSKVISKIKDDIFDYTLVLGDERTQQIKEVVITAQKPIKPKISVNTSKYKKRITIGLLILGTLIVVGGTIYIFNKQKP